MKFSTNWLQTFFETPLPPVDELAEKMTFHSSEIEEVINLPDDNVLDVKVLPDKSAWLMSHRGLAKELSVIFNLPMKSGDFDNIIETKQSDLISITRTSPVCDFYGAALIKGVKVGPSPAWLKESLEAIGQRSINNVVDITNYVMFGVGQPLHAFDASKLSSKDGSYKIDIRQANQGEEIVTLMGESRTLSREDTVITDGNTDQPIGIAGVKGGAHAAVDNETVDIIIESAHFERVAVRNTAKRLKLQTDASKRYENGICAAIAPIGLRRAVLLITAMAGGTCEAESFSGDYQIVRNNVSCSLHKINSVLGLELTEEDVSEIINRFGYEYSWENGVLTVTPPFERDDIVIPEDLIEEVGRIHGLFKIVSITPVKESAIEFNARHYYAEKIRDTIIGLGFSEIYTSSFRNKDIAKLENALASDKQYLRSTLTANLNETLEKNTAHRDLLGLSAVKVFEIGTVFDATDEEFRVALAVRSGTTYKAKVDDLLMDEALEAIKKELGIELELLSNANGVVEFSMDNILSNLSNPNDYDVPSKMLETKYKQFSIYPAISRDIAMWVGEEVSIEVINDELTTSAGDLCVKVTHSDTFSKEGRTSHAFRLVFQSPEKTLTDDEVQVLMDNVYLNVAKQGWEAR